MKALTWLLDTYKVIYQVLHSRVLTENMSINPHKQ